MIQCNSLKENWAGQSCTLNPCTFHTVWELYIRAGQQHAVQKKVRFLSWLFMYFQCKSYISSTDKRYIIGMGSGQINQEAGLMPGSSKRRLFKIPMTSVFPICNYSLTSVLHLRRPARFLNDQRFPGIHRVPLHCYFRLD